MTSGSVRSDKSMASILTSLHHSGTSMYSSKPESQENLGAVYCSGICVNTSPHRNVFRDYHSLTGYAATERSPPTLFGRTYLDPTGFSKSSHFSIFDKSRDEIGSMNNYINRLRNNTFGTLKKSPNFTIRGLTSGLLSDSSHNISGRTSRKLRSRSSEVKNRLPQRRNKQGSRSPKSKSVEDLFNESPQSESPGCRKNRSVRTRRSPGGIESNQRPPQPRDAFTNDRLQQQTDRLKVPPDRKMNKPTDIQRKPSVTKELLGNLGNMRRKSSSPPAFSVSSARTMFPSCHGKKTRSPSLRKDSFSPRSNFLNYLASPASYLSPQSTCQNYGNERRRSSLGSTISRQKDRGDVVPNKRFGTPSHLVPATLLLPGEKCPSRPPTRKPSYYPKVYKEPYEVKIEVKNVKKTTSTTKQKELVILDAGENPVDPNKKISQHVSYADIPLDAYTDGDVTPVKHGTTGKKKNMKKKKSTVKASASNVQGLGPPNKEEKEWCRQDFSYTRKFQTLTANLPCTFCSKLYKHICVDKEYALCPLGPGRRMIGSTASVQTKGLR